MWWQGLLAQSLKQRMGNMKWKSLALAVIGLLLLSIPAWIIYVADKNKRAVGDGELGLADHRRLAQAKAAEDSRTTELGHIQGKTDKLSHEPKVILNDPALSQAWGIEKSQAQKAWRLSQGSERLIVAVIDTGCDLKHEDLFANYWQNSAELPNGKDDDGNGFVDDINGWNFVDSNHDLSDNHGHGTHIAGIIAAMAGNGKGIVGIAPKVKIMCLKYFDPKRPSDHLKNTIAAINYAVQQGAHIINYSGGGLEPSEAEKKAIERAREKGILFVAAAGNERSNSDVYRYYPADYGLDNIISVTAINPQTEVLPSSNYGVQTVDLAAPGQNILSTLPGNSYGFMTGTSQATAFVTGAVALVMAHKPELNYLEVKKYILQTGDPFESLVGKTRTSRKLNLYKALVMMDHTTTLSGLKGRLPTPTLGAEGESVQDSTNSSANPFQELNQFSRELFIKTKKERSASQ
ncbi:MAG: S8 family serine peptidase [Bdellovibrionaceae bacterium]|jgi:subtilisin family serine protease|nr:S8 family serine peptidase [Pseudobdellovibrionaceae bacterium]